jgi:hypothetical protein
MMGHPENGFGAVIRRWAGEFRARPLVLGIVGAVLAGPAVPRAAAADSTAAVTSASVSNSIASFRTTIQPLLREYCHDCHGDGMDKGGVVLDRFASDEAMLADRGLWLRSLKNLRAGIMPPPKKPQPTADQRQQLEAWIKTGALQADPENPDPGRVTVRRLNRAEYRNTIRDLMGIDFDTEKEFPPDDTGHGFDNLADVLTISPMLLEKYLAAASEIVNRAVPMASRAPAERLLTGADFRQRCVVVLSGVPGDGGLCSQPSRALSRPARFQHHGTLRGWPKRPQPSASHAPGGSARTVPARVQPGGQPAVQV